MQTILNDVSDERLRAYIIFLPILQTDDRGSAKKRASEFADKRLAYFWDGDRSTGKLWQRVLDLEGIAWDVYFLYGPEAQWDREPTAPDFWMHQLGHARGKAPLLNKSKFESKVKDLLGEVRSRTRSKDATSDEPPGP